MCGKVCSLNSELPVSDLQLGYFVPLITVAVFILSAFSFFEVLLPQNS
jgi:hypothetical protein